MLSRKPISFDGSHMRSNVSVARLAGFGFELPGERLQLSNYIQNAEALSRLEVLGQQFTFKAQSNSTVLAISAAARALEAASTKPDDIGLIISAPSLLTAYGFEIPAVAARAALKLRNAECLNIAQGCVGMLTGLRIAARHVAEYGTAALVLTGCMASTITEEMSHGAFFWGDAGGAVVVRGDQGPGLHLAAYAEVSAEESWDAMQIPFGDDVNHAQGSHKITVAFPNARSRAEYVGAERNRFHGILKRLLASSQLEPSDLETLFLPSTGRNRAASLLGDDPVLLSRVGTDFSWPHLGGIDVFLFLDKYLRQRRPDGSGWYALLSPAFTAQWAGILLKEQSHS